MSGCLLLVASLASLPVWWPRCLRVWVLVSGCKCCLLTSLVPEVPACLGACLWLQVSSPKQFGVRGPMRALVLVPGCKRCLLTNLVPPYQFGARGACVPGCLFLVASVEPKPLWCPRCLRAWVLLKVASVASLPYWYPRRMRAWVLVSACNCCLRTNKVPEVPACLGAGYWLQVLPHNQFGAGGACVPG